MRDLALATRQERKRTREGNSARGVADEDTLSSTRASPRTREEILTREETSSASRIHVSQRRDHRPRVSLGGYGTPQKRSTDTRTCPQDAQRLCSSSL